MSQPGGHTPMGCDGPGFAAFTAGLVMGTGSTITIKVAYMMSSVGLDGQERLFEKPLTTTFLMFLAMAMSLPLYLFFYHRHYAKEDDKSHWKLYLLVFVPSLFDLIGTALAMVGLFYITVSAYQLIRCTVIIITALLKAFVYHDHLSRHMWLGVGINTLAMVLVSSTTFFDTENATDNRDPRLGVLFIVLSCVVQGTQYVFEEKVMAIDGLPPMVLIGLEGLWGVLLMVAVVFPVAAYLPGSDPQGCLENVWDAWVMIHNSRPLQLILLAFFITVCAYNIFAIFVTHYLSSIWHAILDNFRPISVWSTDLVIYYLLSDGRFGESWTSASWLQLVGMLVLFFGTAVYNGSVPCLIFKDYEWVPSGEPSEQVPLAPHRRTPSLDFITPVIRTTPNMASPALMRSPFMRERSSSIDHHPIAGGGGRLLSSSLPRHGLGQHFTGVSVQQPPPQAAATRGYGSTGGGGDAGLMPGRSGSLDRPMFGKATKPNGVDFDNDGELR